MNRKSALRVAAVMLVLGIMMSMPVSAGNSHQWEEVNYDIWKSKCYQCSSVHNVKTREYECTKCGLEAYWKKASSKHLGIPDIDTRKFFRSCPF